MFFDMFILTLLSLYLFLNLLSNVSLLMLIGDVIFQREWIKNKNKKFPQYIFQLSDQD